MDGLRFAGFRNVGLLVRLSGTGFLGGGFFMSISSP